MQENLNFTKEKRLLNKQSFSLVFNEKEVKFFYKNFLVLLKKNQLDFPRLGIIVPKKVFKKAVDRNLVKRKIRESFRQNQLNLSKIDVIFLLTARAKKEKMDIRKINLDGIWKIIEKKLHS